MVQGQLRLDHFLQKGRSEIQQTKYSQAIQTLGRVIVQDHNNFEAWHLRGLAKYYLKDNAGALRDLTRAIEINPAISSYYLLRGILRDMSGDHYKALEDFTAGLKIDPNDASLYYSRGTTRLRLSNYSLAILDFNEAIRINKHLDEAFINRGIARMKMLRYDDAMADFDQAIYLNPFISEGYNRKGLLFYERKDYANAIEAFNQAIAKDTANPQHYYFRALTYYGADKKDSCLLDLNSVLRIDPDHSLSLYNRAIIRSQTKNFEGAISDYDMLSVLHPYHVLTYFNRGLLKKETGDIQGALWDLDRAILIYPDFAKAYQARSSLKRSLGDLTGAQTDIFLANEKIRANVGKEENDFALNYADTTIQFEDLITLNSRFSSSFTERFEEEIQQGELLGPERVVLKNDSLTIEMKNRPWDERGFILKTKTMEFIASYPVDTLLNHAIGLGEGGNFNQGIQILDEILWNDPGNTLVLFARAQMKFEMIEFVRGTDLISEMVPLQMMGDPINNNQKQQVDYTQVIEDYDKLLELNQDLAIAWMNRAIVKVFNKNYAGAIYDYSRALGLISDYAACWFNLGITQIKTTDGKEGCMNLSKAGELGLERAYRSISLFCNSN